MLLLQIDTKTYPETTFLRFISRKEQNVGKMNVKINGAFLISFCLLAFQTLADQISASLDKLKKILNERGRALGVKPKSAIPIEVPFGKLLRSLLVTYRICKYPPTIPIHLMPIIRFYILTSQPIIPALFKNFIFQEVHIQIME